MKQLPCTIIAVSIGEADTRREPLGHQAMEVTGECPGWDNTCAHPDEGLVEKWETYTFKAERYITRKHTSAREVTNLVDREQGSTCQTSKQFWQATARADAHSGFHCRAATLLCRRCFSVGVVALKVQKRLRFQSTARLYEDDMNSGFALLWWDQRFFLV